MSQAYHDLVGIIARLRSPQGCAWDLKQTHESLTAFLLEETHEVLEAIDQRDSRHLCEELGDLLLQILLHARIESERNTFDIEDVIAGLTDKLIRRHPHVFAADATVNADVNAAAPALDAAQVVRQWEDIKRAERAARHEPDSVVAGIPSTLPSLLRASRMQQRAARVGFDWNTPEQVAHKLEEELEELRVEIARAAPASTTTAADADGRSEEKHAAMEHEFGDVLFTVANVARWHRVNPEDALRKANARFLSRFQCMERHAAREGTSLKDMTAPEWDALWEIAKQRERTAASPTSTPLAGHDHE